MLTESEILELYSRCHQVLRKETYLKQIHMRIVHKGAAQEAAQEVERAVVVEEGGRGRFRRHERQRK